MRVYATGQGRKTDDTDAHSVALVGVRMAGLPEVVNDQTLEVLRLLADRRRRIGADHTRMVCQLHQILRELLPGGAKRNLSAAQARRLLAAVRPADTAGKTRKRVAMELVADLERVYARKKAANKELVELVRQTGTGLLALNGIGPSGAARLPVEVRATCDPGSTSVQTQASTAACAGQIKLVTNLTAIFDLGPLNQLLRAAGQAAAQARTVPRPARIR